MKLIILLLLPVLCFADEQLEFLPRGIGDYKYTTNLNTLEGYKVLRPLKKFKTGSKVCIHGTKLWDEACQDEAFKYAFGDSWREFKDAAVKFVHFAHIDDPESAAKLCNFPFGYILSIVYHFDGSRGYRWGTIEKEEDFFIVYNIHANAYKDFILEDFWSDGNYSLALSRFSRINFVCDIFTNKSTGTINKCIKYKPKITSID